LKTFFGENVKILLIILKLIPETFLKKYFQFCMLKKILHLKIW